MTAEPSERVSFVVAHGLGCEAFRVGHLVSSRPERGVVMPISVAVKKRGISALTLWSSFCTRCLEQVHEASCNNRAL